MPRPNSKKALASYHWINADLSRKILLQNKVVYIENVAPNTSQQGSTIFEAPEGYSLSGIVCFNTSNEWVVPVGFAFGQNGSSCVLNCTGKNFATSTTRADITATCLFVLN